MPVHDKLGININREDIESIDPLSFKANHHKRVLMILESCYISVANGKFAVDA
jgi:hypothetical protein